MSSGCLPNEKDRLKIRGHALTIPEFLLSQEPSMLDLVIQKQKDAQQQLLRMIGNRIKNDLESILTKDELELFLVDNPWCRKAEI